MIGTDRLWLDRSCANFYGICIYPGLAEDGTVTREGASKRCFRRDWAFGPEDGPVRLLRLIRHSNTLQRMDMALAGEPIKIGEWHLCAAEFRCHFHFMSDNEAILLVGESEFSDVTLSMLLRTHVYHLHIDTVGSRGPSPGIQGRGQFGADVASSLHARYRCKWLVPRNLTRREVQLRLRQKLTFLCPSSSLIISACITLRAQLDTVTKFLSKDVAPFLQILEQAIDC
uniref:NR LBD domain-containing protein n=1 Tax=Globodera pallida TaxID=36090 RepID=A0A183CJG8_GLOPA